MKSTSNYECGSIPRGLLRLNADLKAGCSTRIPGETALQHAKRLQETDGIDTLPDRFAKCWNAINGVNGKCASTKGWSKSATAGAESFDRTSSRPGEYPTTDRDYLKYAGKSLILHPCPECGDEMREDRETSTLGSGETQTSKCWLCPTCSLLEAGDFFDGKR